MSCVGLSCLTSSGGEWKDCCRVVGSPGRSGDNNRLFLDAVLWIARTGVVDRSDRSTVA